MQWLSIHKDGQPNSGQRVLTYSETYKDDPVLAFRIMDAQFVAMAKEITHYVYLQKPENIK
jgi:hypothetical protein